jgi:hypothetical protein
LLLRRSSTTFDSAAVLTSERTGVRVIAGADWNGPVFASSAGEVDREIGFRVKGDCRLSTLFPDAGGTGDGLIATARGSDMADLPG